MTQDPGATQPQQVRATSRTKQRELSPFELRQQGRKPPGSDRPRCTDSRGCAGVTAEACADEATAKRCCLSCFKKTCVDLDASCIERAQKGACYLDAEYMNTTCCFACSPDPEDNCSPDPRKRPDVAEGDLTKVFERAIANYSQYGPRVYSRDPWVVGFENLLTDEVRWWCDPAYAEGRARRERSPHPRVALSQGRGRATTLCRCACLASPSPPQPRPARATRSLQECEGVIEAVGGTRGEYLKPSTTAQARLPSLLATEAPAPADAAGHSE